MAGAFVRNHTTGTSASGTAVTATLAAAVPAGNLLAVWVAMDNTGTATPTVSSIDKPGGETATWARIAQHDSSTATSAGGVRGELWAIRTTVQWASGTVITATLSASPPKSHMLCQEHTGVLATLRGTAGTSTSTTGAVSAATSGTALVAGDLVIGAATFETSTAPTGDADTTNGAWSTALTGNTGGGASAAQVSSIMQHKYVTATGVQTYNPTAGSADSGAAVAALQFDPSVTVAAATIVGAAAMPAVTLAQDATASPATIVGVASVGTVITGGLPYPRTITGLRGWWDAIEQTGYSNGASATTVTDHSGLGNNATEATNPPLYETGQFGSRPAFSFNGTSRRLNLTTADILAALNGAACVTVFAVARITDVTLATRQILYFSIGGAASTRLGFGVRSNTVNEVQALLARRLDTDASLTLAGTTILAAGDAFVWSGEMVYTDADAFLWRDQAAEASNLNFLTAGSTSATNSFTAGLGYRSDTGADFWAGQIGAVLVYVTAARMAAADRQGVIDWLTARWFATAATPATIAGAAVMAAPTVTTGATVSPAAITGAAAVPAPSFASGATATPATIAGAASLPAPSVGGGATATPATIAGAVSLPAPAFASNATATPATIARTVSVGAVTVTVGALSQPATIAGVASVGAVQVGLPYPRTITGLRGWWDAIEQTGYSNGASATSVADHSSLGNNATEATNPPTYQTGQINTRPAFVFNGTSSRLSLATANMLAALNGVGCVTVFAVARTDNVAFGTRQLLYFSTNAASTRLGLQQRSDGVNEVQALLARRLDADVSQTLVGTTALAAGDVLIWAAEMVYADADAFLWRGQTAEASNTSFLTAGTTSATDSSTAGIGWRSDTPADFWAGAIGALLIYVTPARMPTADRQGIIDWLLSRWVLSTATPATMALGVSMPAVVIGFAGNRQPATITGAAAMPAPAVTAQQNIAATPATIAGQVAVGAVKRLVAAPGTSVSVAGLQPGSTYRVTVRAVDTSGNRSADSTVVLITTLAAGITQPAIIAGVAAVPSALVTVGALVQPATIAGAAAVATPAIRLDTTRQPATIAGAATIPTPGLGAGASRQPATIVGTATLPAPTVTGAASATPATIAGAAAMEAPAITVAGTRQPATITGAAVIGSPLVALDTFRQPATVVGAVSLAAPVVTVGGVGQPATVVGQVIVGAPLLTVAGTRQPATVVGQVAIPAPSVGGGAAALPFTIVGVAAFTAPVVTFGVVRQVTTIVAVATIGAAVPTVSGIRTPATIVAVVAIGAPVVKFGATAQPASIVGSAVIPLPSVVGGIQGIATPATIATGAVFGAAVIVALAGIVPQWRGRLSVGATGPSVARGHGPAGIPSGPTGVRGG